MRGVGHHKVRKMEAIVTEEYTDDGRKFITVRDPNSESDEPIAQQWVVRQSRPSGRPPAKSNQSFKKLYDVNFDYLVDSGILTNNEMGVFAKLMRFVDWESSYLVHPQTGSNMTMSQLAKWLRMSPNEMMDYMNRLNSKGLITIAKRGGNGYANHFIFNNQILHRGSKIKDIRQVDHFLGECPFDAPKKVRYKERDD